MTEPNTLRLHLDRPSTARIYAYMLDPASPNCYAIDREFGDKQLEVFPDMRKAMRENRRFTGRAVEVAIESGIRQFIDIGSGLPSDGQAHEVADRVAPDARCRVVYVDNEAIAHAHSQLLLAEHADPERHKAVLGDFMVPSRLLREIDATGVIDRSEPVCLLVTALLHFMPPEDEPERLLATYRNRLPAGSMMVLTHGGKAPENDRLNQLIDNYKKTTSSAYLRSDDEIRDFFGDWELLDPGLTWVGLWRPPQDRSAEPWWREDNHPHPPWWEDQPDRQGYRGGVAIKP